MSRSRPFVLVALIVVAVGVAAALGALYLDPARAAVGPLPAEGLVLPADARFVAGIDVRRLVESPHYQKLVQEKAVARIDALNELEQKTGLNPERDVDQVLIAGGGADVKDSGVVLVLGRFDRSKLALAIEQKKGVTWKDHVGTTVYLWGEDEASQDPEAEAAPSEEVAVAFLDDRSAAIGTRQVVESMVAARAQGGASLRNNEQLMGLLEQVRPGATFWMVGDRSLLQEVPKAMGGKSGAAGFELPALQSLIVTGDIDPAVALRITGEARDAEAAKNLADMIRGFAAMATLQAAQKPDLKELASGISVTTDENRVHLNASFAWDLLDRLRESGGPAPDAEQPAEADPSAEPDGN